MSRLDLKAGMKSYSIQPHQHRAKIINHLIIKLISGDRIRCKTIEILQLYIRLDGSYVPINLTGNTNLKRPFASQPRTLKLPANVPKSMNLLGVGNFAQMFAA